MEKVEKTKIKNKQRMDFWIIGPTIILLVVGLIMVSSASSYKSISEYGVPNFYLNQQMKAAFIGVVLLCAATNIKLDWIQILSPWVYVATFALMALVFFPGISHSSGGATRWINTPIGTMQPSEFMKVGLILGVSYVMSKNFKKMDNRIRGLVLPISMIAAVIVQLYFQNHMSAALLMFGTGAAIILASGVRIKKRYFAVAIILALIMGSVFITADGFRLKRIMAMFNKGSDSQGIEWQADQSVIAIGSGKIFGRGLSQSRQKYLWLPEAQTDFIFAILGEEFGFIGSFLVLLCYLIILIRGLITALTVDDLFYSLVAIGIVVLLSAQVIINISVVTNIIPVTGMPLPLLSNGGTAIMINLSMIGILLNISKNRR